MKNILLLFFSLTLFSCNDEKGVTKVSKSNLIDGYYQAKAVFKSDSAVRNGIWIFSKQEINLFDYVEKDYGEVAHQASFKYYIKNNKIYACNCVVDDCLDKNNLDDEFYEIISNEIRDNMQTIILDNGLVRIELTKTKQVCLDVKEFKDI